VAVNGAGPFKRVATIPGPVTGLTATADSNENLTITWKDSEGLEHREYYLASYPMRDEHEREYRKRFDAFEKVRKQQQ
jgi:hypothetical protein